MPVASEQGEKGAKGLTRQLGLASATAAAVGEMIAVGIFLTPAGMIGSLASLMMAAPRVYYAMARDQLFVPALAVLHPRFGTPARAILLQATLASLMIALGTFDQIVGYFVFATVLFLALTVVAVLTLRRARPAPSAYRIPLYPWPPILFLALVVLLLALLAAGRPKESFLGLAIVACGLPVYALVFRNPKREST